MISYQYHRHYFAIRIFTYVCMYVCMYVFSSVLPRRKDSTAVLIFQLSRFIQTELQKNGLCKLTPLASADALPKYIFRHCSERKTTTRLKKHVIYVFFFGGVGGGSHCWHFKIKCHCKKEGLFRVGLRSIM